jgi:hypothetical protein
MRIIIQDVKHLKLKQDLLWVGTATLVTVIFWVAFAIYTAFNKNTIDPSVQKLLTPLNPSLDQEALAVLDDRFIPPENFTPLVIEGEGTTGRAAIVHNSVPTATKSATVK